MDNRPFSEQFYEAGRDWCEKESAASLLEDSKSSVMAQRQTALGDIPVNRAEQIVKASPEWIEYIESTVAARKLANLAKIKTEFLRMRFAENQSQEASQRAEMRMVG